MQKVYLDFETRSDSDITEVGAWNYARDPSTQVLMLAYCFPPAKQIHIWYPHAPFPPQLHQVIERGAQLYAWNAAFDRKIWDFVLANDFDVVVPRADQWHCAAAIARANGLPGKLVHAVEYLFGPEEEVVKAKYQGHALIKLFSVQHRHPNEHPVQWKEFTDYCRNDVDAMRRILYYCNPLPEESRQVYLVNEEVNDRGIRIDKDFAVAATAWHKNEVEYIKNQVYAFTRLRTLQGSNIIKWIYKRLPESIQSLMHSDNKSGFSLDESTRLNLLENELPSEVEEVIKLINSAQSSSTAKFGRMAARSDLEDDRIHDAFTYCGALTTGRFSSLGIQIHNLPRDTHKNPEVFRELVINGLTSTPESIKQLRSMLRPTLIAAPKHQFVSGDWSQIEGRMNPWLSMRRDAEGILDAYRNPNRDVYLETAQQILGRPADGSFERLVYGKVPSLALGYGGGYRAFVAMAKNYNVSTIDEPTAQGIVSTWRAENLWAVKWWNMLERAAKTALRSKRVTECGRLNIYWIDDFSGSLVIQLPSGRTLTYPTARIELDSMDRSTVTVARTARTPKKGEPWPRRELWGGLICENVTQAAAADILMHSLLAKSLQKYIVGHIHDEIILEVPDHLVGHYKEQLEAEMIRLPKWAGELPIAAEVWAARRYKK